MESAGIVVQLVIGIFGATWLYGASSDRQKTRFRNWLSEVVSASKPHLSRLLARGTLVLIAIGAGVVVWESVEGVYTFKTSLDPLTRNDVFALLLNSFNALAYLAGGAACLGLAFSPSRSNAESGKLVISIKENESFSLSITDEGDVERILTSLRQGEARFQLIKASSGRAKLLIDAPKDLLVAHSSAKAETA